MMMRRWSHRQELISDKKLRIYYASQHSSKPPVAGSPVIIDREVEFLSIAFCHTMHNKN
jgi:hypothetical protein